MHPLIADGGEMTVLRDLAAYSYGQWSVDWPESVPDDQRPELPDDRDFGYASKPDHQPGVFARRFVRADVDITAQDFDDAGAPIPFTGESNVEETLDDTSRRTEGDVFFEREITRAGLGALVPRVDFDVDSIVPVLIWGKTIMSPVTSIEDVVELGTVVDIRVYVGGQLLLDDEARERANREIERTIAQERRERVESVSKERKARKSAIASESARSDAYADAVGERVSNSLTAELQAYGEQVKEAKNYVDPATQQVVDFWSEENQNNFNKAVQLTLSAQDAYNDINNIKWLSQDAWNEQQEKINAQNEEFQRLTKQLDAQQSEQIEQIAAVQQQMVQESQGRVREVFATSVRTSDPQIQPTPRDDGKPGWQVELTDMAAGGLFHVQWYEARRYESEDRVRVNIMDELVRTLSEDSSSYTVKSTPETAYMYARWATPAKNQVVVSKSGGPWDIGRMSWETVMTYPAPTKTAHQVALRLKVTWAAATYDDSYSIRIRAGNRSLKTFTESRLGPRNPFGDGEQWMSTTVFDETVQAGETIKVEVYSTAFLPGGRRVKDAELTGTWIEEV